MLRQLPALTWNRTPLRKENEGDTYVDARIDDIANYPGTDRVITVPAKNTPAMTPGRHGQMRTARAPSNRAIRYVAAASTSSMAQVTVFMTLIMPHRA